MYGLNVIYFNIFCDSQVRKANFNSDPYLQTFGISIIPTMVDVHGRVLNPPKIQYGGRVRNYITHLPGYP